MDIKQLQYLVVSIDNGSFKKASELLYTTQPHISKTIKSLEVELGMQLLKRNARGVEATEAVSYTHLIPVKGVYHFSYALNADQARNEAAFCIAQVEKAGLGKDTVIFYDFEYDTVKPVSYTHLDVYKRQSHH